MSFSGFTDDDIKKVQNGIKTDKFQDISPNGNVKIKKAALKVQSKHNKKVEVKNITVLEVSAGAKLFNSQETKPTETFEKHKQNENLNSMENGNDSNVKEVTNVDESAPEVTAEAINEKEIQNTTLDNGQSINTEQTSQDDLSIRQKFKDLEEFQARQKFIEQQNKRRKELLTKALEDRTKKTKEETQRLNEIQNEFKKLDAMLSNDVKILRHQIELASIDYMEAQKRYRKIEREFLDAKIYLHQRLERKELLTEHLCTIIEENEERKAKKLTELLNKLQLSDEVDVILSASQDNTNCKS